MACGRRFILQAYKTVRVEKEEWVEGGNVDKREVLIPRDNIQNMLFCLICLCNVSIYSGFD